MEKNKWIMYGYICSMAPLLIFPVAIGILGLYIASKNITNGYKKHGYIQFFLTMVFTVLGVYLGVYTQNKLM